MMRRQHGIKLKCEKNLGPPKFERYVPPHLGESECELHPYLNPEIANPRMRSEDGRLLHCSLHVKHPVPLDRSFERSRFVVKLCARCVRKLTVSALARKMDLTVDQLVHNIEQLSWFGFHLKLKSGRRFSVVLHHNFDVSHSRKIYTPRGFRFFNEVSLVDREGAVLNPYDGL